MPTPKTYRASCHCGAVRFTFVCDEITNGKRCNCSFCIRRGAVLSASYVASSQVDVEEGAALAEYQFGDKDMRHFFCRACGIAPFSRVASVPPDYAGPARAGDYRINLGCVHDLDPFALDIAITDGRSL